MLALQQISPMMLLPPAREKIEQSPVIQLWSAETELIDNKQEAQTISPSGTNFYPPILMPAQPKQYIKAPFYEFF